MKTANFLLILASICIISCNSNDDLTTKDEKLTSIDNANAKGETPLESTRILQSQLQWASFLVSRTLIENNDINVESQFMNAIHLNQNNQELVTLDDLLGSGMNSFGFYNAFEIQFEKYTTGCGGSFHCPGGDDGPLSNGDPGNFGDDCIDDFCTYLSIVLENNCFEIYLPNGYTSATNSYNSTAHPLIGSAANKGYEHLINSTKNIPVINQLNAPLLTNLLVARPYVFHINGCMYTDYPIDFTLFLN